MNIIYLSYIIALCTIVAKCYCLLICSNVCLDKDLLGESCNYWRRSHIDSCKIHENVIEDFICEQRWFMIYSDISQALTSQPQHEFRAAKEPNVNWSAITAIIKELSKIARKRSKSKNYPDVLQLVMDKTIRYGSEEEEEEEREREIKSSLDYAFEYQRRKRKERHPVPYCARLDLPKSHLSC